MPCDNANNQKGFKESIQLVLGYNITQKAAGMERMLALINEHQDE
ncbi:hypothetical protein FM107_01290 [Sphingobacterium sp. JB170]|nr:hypothetical protein FM107_01290 [Sphingobacterium sp. JB170]